VVVRLTHDQFTPDLHLCFLLRHCSSGEPKDRDDKIFAFGWLRLRDAVCV
jgi:hypothetical protein